MCLTSCDLNAVHVGLERHTSKLSYCDQTSRQHVEDALHIATRNTYLERKDNDRKHCVFSEFIWFGKS
eukprot:m.58835 g.58835  ORF g.58835 m.58835 type:complete len:68 (-) comp11728_c0_seq2:333-536(-)